MKIRTKLIIAFIAPMLLIGLFSLAGFLWNKALLTESSQVTIKKVASALLMKSRNLSLSNNAYLYVLLYNPKNKALFEELANEQLNEINKFEEFPLTPLEKTTTEALKSDINQSITIERSLMQVADQRLKQIQQANQILQNQITPILETWRQQLNANEPEYYEKRATLFRIEINSYKLLINLQAYMLYTNPSLKIELQKDDAAIDNLTEKLSKFNLNKQEIIWLNQLLSMRERQKQEMRNTNTEEEKLKLLSQDDIITAKLDTEIDRLLASASGRTREIVQTISTRNYVMVAILSLLILMGAGLSLLFAKYLLRPIDYLQSAITRIRKGEETEIKRVSEDEIGELSDSFRNLVIENKSHTFQITEQNWLKEHLNEVLKVAQTQNNLEQMCNAVITKLASILNAGFGAFYITKEALGKDKHLYLLGTYAYTKRKSISNVFKFGEGLVGQAALEGKPILLTDPPAEYIHIKSGLGDSQPTNIIVVPLTLENKTLGVIELAAFTQFSEIQQQFLDQLSNSLAVIIEAIQSRQQTEIALKQVQENTEELQVQQEELRASNEELEEKSNILQQSEEELKASNEELEEKMHAIELQKTEIETKNNELESVKLALEKQAKELTRSGKYKTEFLSNMSHELRTPLNSLLLLSKSFANNEDGNLTPEQIDQANIIYKGGRDLLELINDILDLSKVEAGKLNIQIEEVFLSEIVEDLKRQFDSVVSAKGLKFVVENKSNKSTIKTDSQRLKQILRNLISNAVKFTKEGHIKLLISTPNKDVKLNKKEINSEDYVEFDVIDTGIGIEKEKFSEIFEAFQQAYGNTDRTYGGTGLGLTISRELAKLLGGEILLESEVGKGSQFSLILPIQTLTTSLAQYHDVPATTSIPLQPPKKIQLTSKEKNILLILSDDEVLNELLKITSKKGYRAMIAASAKEGLALAKENPLEGIIISLDLPDMDGENLLMEFKEICSSKKIPIHVISGHDTTTLSNNFKSINFIKSPTTSAELDKIFAHFSDDNYASPAHILLVEDDVVTQNAIVKAIKSKNIEMDVAATGKEGIKFLLATDYDGVILDLRLPDMDGIALLKTASDQLKLLPPVVIYSQKDLTAEEYIELNHYTNKIIRKEGDTSIERLLNECSLFLHSVHKNDSSRRRNIKMLSSTDDTIKNKEVLLVDDDMRNVYALSVILQRHGMKVIVATNGIEALKKLEENKSIDIIIMDIMMPILDGYETMRRIRKQKKYQHLPIIAVTAKAMPEDKKACIDAGANDYITKPIDDEKLLSILHIWLSSTARVT